MMDLLTRSEVAMALFLAALGLTYYWALRKAPPGQAAPVFGEVADDSASARARDRMARTSVLGLLLLGAGGFAAASYSAPVSIIALPILAVGYLLMNRAIAQSRHHRHDSPGARRIMTLSSSVLTAALLGGSLWVGNALAFKYFHRPLDFTNSGVHSLSQRSADVLRTLKAPLRLTVFASQDPRAGTQFAQLNQLLQLYAQENRESIQIRRVDRYADMTEFEALATKYPELVLAQAGGLLIEYGEGDETRHFMLDALDLFGRDAARAGVQGRVFEFNAEDAVTSALVRLFDNDKPFALFIVGHGELSIDETDANAPSLSLLKSRLEFLGVTAARRNLTTEDIPDETALAVIAAPKTPFQPEEAAKLKAYLDRGGRALFFLGPNDSGLAALLAESRVEVGKLPVYDRQFQFRGSLTAPIPPKPDHPIMAPLAGARVLMPSATAIAVKPAQDQTVSVEPIVRSSAQSWVESQPSERPEPTPGKDEIGPAVLAVAASKRDPKTPNVAPQPKLVVFSSPYAAENGSMLYNQPMIMNAASWLRGKTELLGIPPKSQTALTLTDDPRTRSRLMLVPTLISFALIVGIGIAVHMARRN